MRIGFLIFAVVLSVVAFGAKESCLQGDCVDGNGTKQYADGSSYEGTFKAGLRSGFGIYRHLSGVVYEGEFLLDRFEGRGVMSHADGRRYEGGFKAGLYHGFGEYRWGDGTVYTGEFNEGEFYTGTLNRLDGSRKVYEEGKRLE